METPTWFNEWLNKNLILLSPTRAGAWLAVDDSGVVIDEDTNSNQLISRVGVRSDARSLRIVYIFPAIFQ